MFSTGLQGNRVGANEPAASLDAQLEMGDLTWNASPASFPQASSPRNIVSSEEGEGDSGQHFPNLRNSAFNTQTCSVLDTPGNVVQGKNFKFQREMTPP